MDSTAIILATVVLAVIAILVGILLSRAAVIFKVEVDEKEIAIRECLPGNNCGACGYPGCDGMAKAIAEGKAPVNGCPVGGEDVGKKISQITGKAAAEKEKMVAIVKCKGDCEKAKDVYKYVGPLVCDIAANSPNQGPKACRYGCLGYGECKAACEFGAISIVDGIAVIDPEKCRACGKCIEVCPRNIITLVPYSKKHHILCNSQDKGVEVRKNCSAGCLGCGLCQRSCPKEAIEMKGNLPVIDYSKCVNCGLCEKKCPAKTIS